MEPRVRTASARRIGVLGFDGVMLLDLSGPAEVFVAANRQVPDSYAVDLLAPDSTAVATSIGAAMSTTPVPGSGSFDTVIVAGSDRPVSEFMTGELVAAVRDLNTRARRLASVCTGAFVLAAAGLFDGRCATTHWKYVADLARRYPAVEVADDAVFLRHNRIYSAAGAAAGIDLALALVEEDLGFDVAGRVARDLLVYQRRRGGQSQFSPSVREPAGESEVIRQVADAVFADPAAAHAVPDMAALVHLSERQLTRVFRRELCTTPAAFVANLRFEMACDRLRGGATVTAAAQAAGYSGPEMMRRTFVARSGMSPRDFQRHHRTMGLDAARIDVANSGVSGVSGEGTMRAAR